MSEDFEQAWDKALEEGDACPRCLCARDGTRLGLRHARTCPFRLKHGCPECGTRVGPHGPGCSQEITDQEQADHEAWAAKEAGP